MIYKVNVISGKESCGNKISMTIDKKHLETFQKKYVVKGTEFKLVPNKVTDPWIPCKFIGRSRVDNSPMFVIDVSRLAGYVNNEYHLTLYKQDGDTNVEITLADIRTLSEIETFFYSETHKKKPSKVIHKFNIYECFEL